MEKIMKRCPKCLFVDETNRMTFCRSCDEKMKTITIQGNAKPISSMASFEKHGTVPERKTETSDNKKDESIEYPKTNIWIVGLKIVATVIFLVIAIFGFFYSRAFDGADYVQLGVMLLFLIIAFFVVAGLMIFLNMAQDITQIKSIMKEQRDKSK